MDISGMSSVKQAHITICVKIMGHRNNTHIVVTDATGAHIFFKLTGGMFVKNSRKNSTKTAIMLLTKLQKKIQMLKLPIFSIRWEHRNVGSKNRKKPTPAVRQILRGMFGPNARVVCTTPISHGFLSPKGGSRGRKP